MSDNKRHLWYMPQCWGTRKDGKRCEAAVGLDRNWCHRHQPRPLGNVKRFGDQEFVKHKFLYLVLAAEQGTIELPRELVVHIGSFCWKHMTPEQRRKAKEKQYWQEFWDASEAKKKLSERKQN